MKKSIITTAILVSAIWGFAQRGPGPQSQQVPTPEQAAQRQANSLSERLSLSEDQRSKAYSVFLDRAKKEQTERTARLKEMQKQRQQDSIQRKQESDKISQLLTPDQKKRFEEFRQQRNRPSAGFNRQGGTPPQGGFGFRRDMPNQQLRGPGNGGQGFRPAPGRRPGGDNNGPQFGGGNNAGPRVGGGGIGRQRPGQDLRPQPDRRFQQRPELQNRMRRPAPPRGEIIPEAPVTPAQPAEKS